MDKRDPRVEHAYEGNGLVNCLRCDLPKGLHRVRELRERIIDKRYVEHHYEGNLESCVRCNLPLAQHITPRTGRIRPRRKRTTAPDLRTHIERVSYIGIDGEGQGREDHRYVLLAASDESGDREWSVEASNPRIGRLTSEECLNMILELPTRRARIFSFSFNYDITMILRDLDNKSLYDLFRPELFHRQRPKCEAFKGPYPVVWCPKCKKQCEFESEHHELLYKLNLMGTKLSVKRGKKRVVIWDLFKFFQSKFVAALEDWKVPGGDGSEKVCCQHSWETGKLVTTHLMETCSARQRKAILDNMTAMKDQRQDFDKLEHAAVKDYCLEECRCIAELARRLVESHTEAGLKLKSYYGAGSSGAAMLTVMDVKKRIFPAPKNMWDAVASSFFGGRFENSVIGAIREPLNNLDISSAYVYQLAFLPCLEHGVWTHTTRRKDLEKAQAQAGALVRYSLGPNPRITSWGPFPFRTRDGTISFPSSSGGGWIWLDEYLAGEKLFPTVQFHEAFVYSCNCACRARCWRW